MSVRMKTVEELSRENHEPRQRLEMLEGIVSAAQRKIHDDIQQLLVAVKIQAGISRAKAMDTAPIREIVRLTDEALAACRSLVAGLNPPLLRNADLSASLQWLVRYMDEQHGLRVESKIAVVPAMGEAYRRLLFEVARELLFNVAKHAGVKEATLELGCANDQIWIEVADEGEGCEPVRLEAPGRDSFGLFAIRARLGNVGGRLLAQSEPGEGCRIRASVPVGQADEPQPDSDPSTSAKETAPPPQKKAVRVLIADDHQILRQGLATLLASQPDTQVIAQASDGIEALEMTLLHKPDVVVMDISMPRMNGLEATKRIKAQMPEVFIIGLSMHASEEMAKAMQDVGANAYVSKVQPIEQLLALIREV